MQIQPFATEQYFAIYEFTTHYTLCASDCESMSIGELLDLAAVDPSSLAGLHLGYTETQGEPALRATIAANYGAASAEDIVVLTAPEEGIYLTLRALLQPGDHVVALTPAYDSLLNLAEHISGNVSRWPVRPTAGGWALDIDELRQLVTPKTRLLIVNFPHNPTGLLPSPADFKAIIAVAQEHGAWLLCDEMYRGLEQDSAQRLPSAADRYERAIVLAGLSKVHGLPGLRSGWLVARDDDLRARLINWKHYTTICPPAPSEFLARVALQVQDKLIARNRAIIDRNVALAEAFFSRWSELFDWRPPQAGSVALVGLNKPSASVYCEALARDAGVLLLPGSCLGAGDQTVRFGFGRASFAEGLDRYEDYLEATERA